MCICIAYRLLVSLNATIAIVDTGEEHVISLTEWSTLTQQF